MLPSRWASCAKLLIRDVESKTRERLVTSLSELLVDYIPEAHAAGQTMERLLAVASVLEERPHGSTLPQELAAALRRGTSIPRLASLLEGAELDRGMYRGRPVTAAVVATVVDVATLERMVKRLPSPRTRGFARVRIVDLRIQQSEYEWVRQHADEVRARVLQTGVNAYPGAVSSATYRPSPPAGIVLVEQDLGAQTGRLLFRRGETAAVPAIPMRGTLLFEVGIGKPITLCDGARALDVTPCVEPGRVTFDTKLARLGKDGNAHLQDGLRLRSLLPVLDDGKPLRLGILIDGAQLAEVRWPVHVLTPRSVVYRRGEHLNVRVEALGSRIVVHYGRRGERSGVAVIEGSAVGHFTITSRGTRGRAGAHGYAGSNGRQGMRGRSASCPSSRGGDGERGGNGGRGGDGGSGGPGGRGGDVFLTVACSDGCETLGRAATRLVRSLGGPGGRGGQGGPGGSGGMGGSGGSGTSCREQTGYGDNARTTTKYLSGGSSGMRGSDGMRGSNGASGRAGSPGQVHVRYERQ